MSLLSCPESFAIAFDFIMEYGWPTKRNPHQLPSINDYFQFLEDKEPDVLMAADVANWLFHKGCKVTDIHEASLYAPQFGVLMLKVLVNHGVKLDPSQLFFGAMGVELDSESPIPDYQNYLSLASDCGIKWQGSYCYLWATSIERIDFFHRQGCQIGVQLCLDLSCENVDMSIFMDTAYLLTNDPYQSRYIPKNKLSIQDRNKLKWIHEHGFPCSGMCRACE